MDGTIVFSLCLTYFSYCFLGAFSCTYPLLTHPGWCLRRLAWILLIVVGVVAIVALVFHLVVNVEA
jgi:hypothetical protein